MEGGVVVSFHVRDDFKAGAPVSQVPVSWFNKVASFLNNLVGGYGVTLMKAENGPSVIEVDKTAIPSAQSVSRDVGTPTGVGSFPIDEVTQSASTLWQIGGANGATLLLLYQGEYNANTGIHKTYAAKLTVSKDGLITKIEAVQNGGMEIGA